MLCLREGEPRLLPRKVLIMIFLMLLTLIKLSSRVHRLIVVVVLGILPSNIWGNSPILSRSGGGRVG